MCNCGRKAPSAVTSVQAALEEQARRAEDQAVENARAVLSAHNAIGNSNAGWFAVEDPVPSEVLAE